MNKSINCLLKKHEVCEGEYETPRGPKKGRHVCECECHARHIAPTLEELSPTGRMPYSPPMQQLPGNPILDKLRKYL